MQKFATHRSCNTPYGAFTNLLYYSTHSTCWPECKLRRRQAHNMQRSVLGSAPYTFKVGIVKLNPAIIRSFTATPLHMSSKRPRPAPASDNDLQKLVSTGWEKDDKRIRKSFKFKGFRRAWAFMTEVALKADELDHHPEWTNVRYYILP